MNYKKGNFDPKRNTATFYDVVSENKLILNWAIAHSDVGFVELWYHTDDAVDHIKLTLGALSDEQTYDDLACYWRFDDAVVLSFIDEADSTALAVYLAVTDHEDVFYKVDYDLDLYERGKLIVNSLESHPDTLRAVWRRSYKHD